MEWRQQHTFSIFNSASNNQFDDLEVPFPILLFALCSPLLIFMHARRGKRRKRRSNPPQPFNAHKASDRKSYQGCLMTSAKFRVSWPPSPCPHLDLIYTIKFTQHPMLHLLFNDPPDCRHHIWKPQASRRHEEGLDLGLPEGIFRWWWWQLLKYEISLANPYRRRLFSFLLSPESEEGLGQN